MNRPIYDLYVGSVSQALEHRASSLKLEFSPLNSSNLSRVRECTAMAFMDADIIDTKAYERVLNTYLDQHAPLFDCSWLLYLEEQPAGASLLSLRDYYSSARAYPYIDLIAILPQYQHKGLGRALLQQSIRSLKQSGHQEIVHAHIRRGNSASEQLFKRHDFMLWLPDDRE